MKTHKVRPVLVESKEITNIWAYKGRVLRYNEANFNDEDDSEYYELILISLEDEKIEVSDTYYNLISSKIKICESESVKQSLNICKSHAKKVIARQSQIPPEYISKFIEQYNRGGVEDLEIERVEIYDWSLGEDDINLTIRFKPKLTNGFVTIVEKEYSYNLLSNMQYYMEYCQANGYVTPQDWLNKFKHYSDRKEPISYTEGEVLNLLHKLELDKNINLAAWFENNKKK